MRQTFHKVFTLFQLVSSNIVINFALEITMFCPVVFMLGWVWGGGYLPQPLPYMAIQVRLAFRSHQGPKGGPLIPIPSGEAPLCSCGTFRAIALAFPFHFLLPPYLKSSLHP